MLKNHYYDGLVEAGCDEAGRGCLAGSVFAAAVILPEGYDNPDLNDSKQLTAKRRYRLREQIEHDALAWAVGEVTAEEIDHVNILHASFLAMHRAIDQLRVRPEALIVDGNRFDPYIPGNSKFKIQNSKSENCLSHTSFPLPSGGGGKGGEAALPHTCIIKGDAKYQAIAAASILAKTYRDDYMKRMALQYPYYDWEHNMGYPTRKHYLGIEQHGITPIHRRSFNLYRQLSIDFGE